MSLTKVTYSMVEDAPIDVTDYGAVGDNVTDDGNAIQSAINAAIATNKPLYIPQKTFLSSTDLVISGDIKLKCDGTIRYTGTGTALLISSGQNTVIDGVRVIRSYTIAGQAASAQLLYTGIWVRNSNTSAFYNLYVEGFADGLKVGQGSDNVGTVYNNFYNINILNCLRGIYLYGDRTKNQWANENKWFGGRIIIQQGGIIFSNYTGVVFVRIENIGQSGFASANKFYGVTLEAVQNKKVEMFNADDNAFVQCYWEGVWGGTDIEVNGSRNYFSGKDLHFNVIKNSSGNNPDNNNTFDSPIYRQLGGGTRFAYKIVDASMAVGGEIVISGQDYIFADTSAGGFTLRLGQAGIDLFNAQQCTIKKISTDSNSLVVQTSGGAGRAFHISAPKTWITLIAAGNFFRKVGGYSGSKVVTATLGAINAGESTTINVSDAFFVNPAISAEENTSRFIEVSYGNLVGCIASAYPHSVNNARIVITNPTSGSITPGDATFYLYFDH